MAEVHALVIDCGRRVGDDLPPRSTGARVVCYASGDDLEEAMDAATAVVREAGMEPRAAGVHEPLSERLARGELSASERLLIERVLSTGRVVIVELTPTYDPS
jgi:hypothetical protein